MRRTLTGWLAAVCLLSTGCTDGTETNRPMGTTASTSSSPQATATSLRPTATPTTAPGRVTYRDAGFNDEEDYLQFMLPSRNIGCSMGQAYVTCEVNDATWPGAVRNCNDGDWDPHAISLNSGRVFLGECASDTVMGGELTLAYGEGLQSRDVRCASARSGLRCELRSTGRGFEVSRSSFRRF